MRRLVLLAAASCGPTTTPAPAPVLSNEGEAIGSPCYPGRSAVKARDLHAAIQHQGDMGTCAMNVEMLDLGAGPEESKVVREGERLVGVYFECAFDVYVPGLYDDHGITVGDSVELIRATYPEPAYAYDSFTGNNHRTNFHVTTANGRSVTYYELDDADLANAHVYSVTQLVCE